MTDAEFDVFYVITLGRSGRAGRMAVFDEAGDLAGWTTSIKLATRFRTAAAGAAAIRAICFPEYERAVHRGRAVREYDDEQDEVIYAWPRSNPPKPYELPGIAKDGQLRSLLDAPETSEATGRREIYDFVKSEIREAKARGRPTHNYVRRMGDEEPTPMSHRLGRPRPSPKRVLWSDLGLLNKQKRERKGVK